MGDPNGILVLYSLMTGFFAGVGTCVLLYNGYRWYQRRRDARMNSVLEYLN